MAVRTLVERTADLFRFLARLQQVREQPVGDVLTNDRYAVTWLGTLPDHDAVTAQLGSDVDDPDLLLTVRRVALEAPPEADERLDGWLTSPRDDVDRPPTLRESRWFDPPEDEPDSSLGQVQVTPDQVDGLEDDYRQWLQLWRQWGDHERACRPARQLYKDLFASQATLEAHAESFEAVLGVGLLSWKQDSKVLRRHLATAPVDLVVDEDTGTIRVRMADGPWRLEDEMLDAGSLPAGYAPIASAARDALAGDDGTDDRDGAEDGDTDEPAGSVFDADSPVRMHVVRVALAAHAEADVDDGDWSPASPQAWPVTTFAPALLVRPRSSAGLADLLGNIVDQVVESGTVPEGLVPLVDPDLPLTQTNPPNYAETGARPEVDGEAFLPKPVNREQLRVIDAADRHAQVLVQGPPGTGKTHVVATLLAHQLAQGKRVLVTAATERALAEVRDKLPDQLKSLAVSVIGRDRVEMESLQVAVEGIAAAKGEHDPDALAAAIVEGQRLLDQLADDREKLRRALEVARKAAAAEVTRPGFVGRPADLAQQVAHGRAAHGWIDPLVPAELDVDAPCPLSDDEAVAMVAAFDDAALATDFDQAMRRWLPDHDALVDAATLRTLVDEVTSARADTVAHPVGAGESAGETFKAVAALAREERHQLRELLDALADEADVLADRHEPWMDLALADVQGGRGMAWRDRHETVQQLLDAAADALGSVSPSVHVQVTTGPLTRAQLGAATTTLAEYLDSGGQLRTTATGQPKLGMFTSRAVKEAAGLFDQVTVDGLAPTTREQLAATSAHLAAADVLDQLDRAWPERQPSGEQLAHQRLAWHRTEQQALTALLEFAGRLENASARLDEAGVRRPSWNDLAQVRAFADVVDGVDAAERLKTALQPLQQLMGTLSSVPPGHRPADVVEQLKSAVHDLDVERWVTATRRLAQLEQVREQIEQRQQWRQQLSALAPALADHLTPANGAPDDTSNDTTDGTADVAAEANSLQAAWQWVCWSRWLSARDEVDESRLYRELEQVELRIRDVVERLAADRAWSHALSDERLPGRTRAALIDYGQRVKRLGAGTGKYGDKRRRDVRDAMDRSRSAVPAWIMPLHRIVEQFRRIEPNMFDLVIVDEASQAGVDAVFLQFLAPRIVVVGDDKQVSPSGVGLVDQDLTDLAAQYLHDDEFAVSWADKQQSLFAVAKQRFGKPITLVEHHRCVPEIIGFSNKIAYEPATRLLPVRARSERGLQPVVPVHVKDGYQSRSSTNPPEAQAIVDTLVACLDDPAYDGATFGVVTLLGTRQHDLIRNMLVDTVGADVMLERQIRCGTPPDFQGSERDVMMLSMVAAPSQDRRVKALTGQDFMRRFNVAASRARDQMWVFHTVGLDELSNPQDLRLQLLDYAYRVQGRDNVEIDGASTLLVPEDEQVAPFDSLFEQRVHNRIVSRGHTVVPQYPSIGYHIDLAVFVGNHRIAVECDGDYWHGPEQAGKDLARRRDLQRCGWEYYDVREVAFYSEPDEGLGELWELLDELSQPDDIVAVRTGASTEPATSEVSAAATDVEPAAPPDSAIDAAKAVPSVAPTEPLVPEHGDMVRVAGNTADQPAPAGEQSPLAAPPAEPDGQLAPPAAIANGEVAPYQEFAGPAQHPRDLDDEQLAQTVHQLVLAEGPVLGARILKAYTRVMQGRLSQHHRDRILAAADRLVADGKLETHQPAGDEGDDRTDLAYRVAGTPTLVVRTSGSRAAEHIPVDELATILTLHRQGNWEDTLRAAMAALGRKQLNAQLRAAFDVARARMPAR